MVQRASLILSPSELVHILFVCYNCTNMVNAQRGGKGAVQYTRRALGQLGEDIAVRHLQRMGYIVLQRNYRCTEGEVDIVARDHERLAFVEVRARRGTAFGTAKESVTARKQARLATVALCYLQEHGYSDADWGIDVVAVQLTPRGTLQHIELIRNAIVETG